MTLSSELGTMLEAQNEDGRSIRCLLETPQTADHETPCVVVLPSYALSIRHFGPASLFLTRNGFRSLRFDYTNHVGASDGDVFDFKLSSAAADVRTVLAALREWGVPGPVGILSVSMGARIAFRALRGHADIAAMVSLVGVVNLRDTMQSVVGDDVVAECLRGEVRDREVLGYHISGRFVNDAVDHDLHSLESTKRDVAQCRFPITHVYAEDDAWTRLDEVESVFGHNGATHSGDTASRQLYVLPEASHKLEYNPVAARTAFCLAVGALALELTGAELTVDQVLAPSFNDVVEKNRLEIPLDGEVNR